MKNTQEYHTTIQALARYEFGRGIYTEPSNPSQVLQVESLQLRIAEHYPDLKSAKQVLKDLRKQARKQYV